MAKTVASTVLIPPTPDVLVVGAGVIGCSIAYACVKAGLRVTVVERDRIGAGASGASAGMLAPQVEAHHPDSFFSFGLAGRAEHEMIAAQLRDEAGLDVEYRKTGIFRVALEERDAVDLQARAVWQREHGLAAQWMASDELARAEPMFAGAVGMRVVGALWLPDESQTRSPRLVRALATAAIQRGADFREGQPVTGLVHDGRRVTGIMTPAGVLKAGTTVLSAGVWSASIAAASGVALSVEPIRGQILALRTLTRSPKHILWTHDCYIAPKVDGQLVIGATEERAGFDSHPTMSGMLQLAIAATDVLPELGRLPIEAQWAGLRPASPDRLPIIGWAPGYDGLFLATAHFRNGVLLGPLTGRLVAEMVQGNRPSYDIAEYTPQRFVPGAQSTVERPPMSIQTS